MKEALKNMIRAYEAMLAQEKSSRAKQILKDVILDLKSVLENS